MQLLSSGTAFQGIQPKTQFLWSMYIIVYFSYLKVTWCFWAFNLRLAFKINYLLVSDVTMFNLQLNALENDKKNPWRWLVAYFLLMGL